MAWEYRQLEVRTAGWWDWSSRIPDNCFDELNRLAREGWEVLEVARMQRSLGRTDYVSFILKRELQ